MKKFLNRHSDTFSSPATEAPSPKAENVETALIDEAVPATDVESFVDAIPLAAASRGVTVVSPLTGTRPIQTADITHVEQLAAAAALVQLRLFRSFDYSAALFFHEEGEDFYVALYQEQMIWRAFVASELDSAEIAFRHVQDQIVRMTEGEVRLAQLKAQNERLAKMAAQTEAHAERLRNDIERDTAQNQLVSVRQHEIRRELAQHEALRAATQAHLNKAARQVASLRLTNTEVIPHPNSRREDPLRK